MFSLTILHCIKIPFHLKSVDFATWRHERRVTSSVRVPIANSRVRQIQQRLCRVPTQSYLSLTYASCSPSTCVHGLYKVFHIHFARKNILLARIQACQPLHRRHPFSIHSLRLRTWSTASQTSLLRRRRRLSRREAGSPSLSREARFRSSSTPLSRNLV